MPVYVEKRAQDRNRQRAGGIAGSSMSMLGLNHGQQKEKQTHELVFALSVQLFGRHGREENSSTYSFYPLYREDLTEVVKMMIYYTGSKPIDESDRIQEILAYRMDTTRQEVIVQLLQQENPWIEHYNDLKSVVVNLTVMPKPPSMYEMERLYHSCRREPDVTRECLEIIRVRPKLSIDFCIIFC